MTREEAVIILDGFKNNPLFNEQHFEVFDMAISALSNNGNSISRQAVLNTLDNMEKALDEDRTVEKYKELLTECIKMLPSAENKGDLIRQAEDYENEIADLHNRLDIAEYDKERYKEEITILEAENKGEWIPVSERLPKAFETVLRTKVENGWNGTTCTIVDTGCICPSDYNIVAWMPLPEPYKKGGE